MGNFLEDTLDNVGKPFSKGFTRGTHEVLIGEAEATTKDTKKQKDAPVIIVTVFDETDNDKTAKATLWFHSEGGAKMSVAKVLGILVHNVGDEKKDDVRELGKKLFGSAETPEKAREIAIKLITDKLIGKKAYAVADPQNDKYTTTSYVDLWHYPAKVQSQSQTELAGEDITDKVNPEDLPDFSSEV